MRLPIQPSLAAAARILVTMLGLWFASGTVRAISFQHPAVHGIPRNRETLVVVRGVIQVGDHHRFHELLDRVSPDIVVMDGPGGVVEDALIMAEEIHARGLKTLIGPQQVCVSACAMMFLSGRIKYQAHGSAVGLHAPFDLEGNASPEAGTLVAEHLAHYGVPADILARMGRTKPSDIWWLGPPEQNALDIRTIEVMDEIAPKLGRRPAH